MRARVHSPASPHSSGGYYPLASKTKKSRQRNGSTDTHGDLSMTSEHQGSPPAPPGRFAEVWGDTVDLKHLAWAIGIGIGISIFGFYVASHWLTSVVESKQLAHAYAMLAGLAGCIIAGVICAKAFPPKREVTETEIS